MLQWEEGGSGLLFGGLGFRLDFSRRIGRAILAHGLALIFMGVSSVSASLLDQLDSKTPTVDSDGDGKIDIWRTFDSAGKLLSAAYDNNGDGQPDEWIRYEGAATIREISSHFDGKVDERFVETLAGPLRKPVRKVHEVLEPTGWFLHEERLFDEMKRIVTIKQFRKSGEVEVRHEPLVLR